MGRWIALLFAATMMAGVAVAASAGVLDDQTRHIKVTYDDADWKAGPNGWQLACTNVRCVSIECGPEDETAAGTDKEALRSARDMQEDLLDLLGAKALQKPVIRTLGATPGVYRSYLEPDDESSYYIFSFMTPGPARRVTLSCTGETDGGKPISDLVEKLFAGITPY